MESAERYFLTFLFLAFVFCHTALAQDFEFFEKKIRPVLVERCYKCHSHEAEKIKGELFLDSKEGMLKGGSSGKAAIVPGEPEASKLIEAIRYSNDELQMPPPKIGKLTDQQISDFVAWIKGGAPDPRTKQTKTVSVPDKVKIAKEHWAFQPVKKPAVPKLAGGTGSRSINQPRTPIDNFIIEKLSSKGLQLSPQADKRTLIRRATFDLTGLPPTPEQVEAFLSDKSSDAFARVVDRLLTSPQYGERWGRYWLDVARFADTKGYVYGDREETKFIQSAAYRDWVIKAFNEDMPYDRFLKLQIAADQLEETEINSLAAMGFLTLGRRFLGVVHDIIDDRIDVVMRGTQALTVGCARCHDHKFDPIPTKDYYSLYGVFAGCNEREVPLRPDNLSVSGYLAFEKELKSREDKFQSLFNAKRDALSKRLRSKVGDYLVAVLNVEKFPSEEFYSFVQADDLNAVIVRAWHGYLLSTSKSFHPIWALWHGYAALPKNKFAAKAGAILTSFTNASQKLNPVIEKAFSEKIPSSMVEVAETYGKLLSTVDKKWNDAADKAKALSKEEEELRQVLYAEDSPANVPAGAIVDLEWYFDEASRVELGKLCSQIDKWILQSTGAPPYAVILEDRPVQKNPRVFKRGNPVNKGEEVPRQFLEILAGEKRQPFSKGSGRLGLAEAIGSKSNPLTARVFVNRMWLHHFGAGLVRTPSDFGVRAEPPTHPELLDWLAIYFMDNGWSVKKVHRLMMLSAVYQQASIDRSSISSGSRQFKSSGATGGMSVKAEAGSQRKSASQIDPENKLLWRMNRQRLDFEALRDSLLAVSGQLESKIGGKAEEMFKVPYSKRRSIYGFIDRQFLPGALRIFDFANPDMHNPQRSETTVPQQALFFMNSPFVVEQARALAGRISGKADDKRDVEERIIQFYQIVYQRNPTPRQLEQGLNFVKSSLLDEPFDVKQPANLWSYGYGQFDETSKQVKAFTPLPHFTGDAWQGGKAWPDEKLGWAQLTASGGHAGNDQQHMVIRRWSAPSDGTFAIEATLKHEHAEGDGVDCYIVSSRKGSLGNWTVHNKSVQTKVDKVELKEGDTIDFVTSIHHSLNNNDFIWSPAIRMIESSIKTQASTGVWNAAREFGGPPGELPKPLTPWEQYAQVLLLSNEFLFVD